MILPKHGINRREKPILEAHPSKGGLFLLFFSNNLCRWALTPSDQGFSKALFYAVFVCHIDRIDLTTFEHL